jgi:uncharacterized lipoprotein YmbA
MTPRFSNLGLLLAAVVLASGCASPPNRYYTLTTPPGASANIAPASETAPVFIELAPIALPERLARPQMVVTPDAGGSAAVQLLEQHRWTSSLENELRDALASGIASRLGAIDVSRGGRPQHQPAWRIAVQLRQFDAVENTRVDAAFSWTLRRSDADRSAACQWSGSEAVGNGIDALAQGAQRVTDQAANAIARHLTVIRDGNMDAACRFTPP